MVDLPLHPSTHEYGRLFETFVISQIRAVLDYLKVQAQLSYLEVKDGGEIDLIVERPGLPTLLVEIRSGETVREEDLLALKTYTREFGGTAQAVCFYQGTLKRRLGGIDVLPWKEGLKEVGLWMS